jgi:O-succinylbenzoate synthase
VIQTLVRRRTLRIDAIEAYYVVLPLIQPWRTAYGEDADIHSVLVRMISEDSEGWGETTPFFAPTYSPETATSAFFLISEVFAPILAGRDLSSGADVLAQLFPFKGNPFAKAGVEAAWWMLKAEVEGQPLHRLLGGTTRDVDAGPISAISRDLLDKIQVWIAASAVSSCVRWT